MSYYYFAAGRIGITTDITWPEPKSDSEEDRIASELSLEFYVSTTKYFFFSSYVSTFCSLCSVNQYEIFFSALHLL